jgi:hypothetical protein
MPRLTRARNIDGMSDEGITPERRAELEREVSRIVGGFRQQLRDWASTPVVVRTEVEDDALDDHLWVRVGELFRDDPSAMLGRIRATRGGQI